MPPVTGRIGVAKSLHRASGLTSSKVVRYEKTCRTFKRGKANERGFIHVCVLWEQSPKAASQYRKGHTANTVVSGFAHAGLLNGLSRMKGNFHVRFSG